MSLSIFTETDAKLEMGRELTKGYSPYRLQADRMVSPHFASSGAVFGNRDFGFLSVYGYRCANNFPKIEKIKIEGNFAHKLLSPGGVMIIVFDFCGNFWSNLEVVN